MNTKRNANRVLMNHWVQAWTTLGRWQQLNARLSRELSQPALDPRSSWTLHSNGNFSRPAALGAVSAKW
jgi:hypothetical protein